jgi:hypothetical protein
MTAPPTIRTIGNNVSSKLSHHPRNDQDDSGREDQTRWTAECALGYRRKSAQVVTIAGLLNGLEGAHITGQKAEDGYTKATLPWNSQNRPLQYAGAGICVISRGKEVIVPTSSKMCQEDQN